MFAARGIAVASSVFFLVYVALSLVVCCTWHRVSVSRHVRNLSTKHCADLLFALRMFPLTAALLVTLAFTVPSFVLLEPHAIEEPIGWLPLALGTCGLCVIVFGLGSAVAALMRASRLIALWGSQANAVETQVSVPVLRIDRIAPALTAAGILRPRVLLSGTAELVLNENELHTALRHEVAHIRRRDNLKKLLLRFVAFPAMKSLEAAWLESTEMAADDAAVGSLGDALDLAAALIKLSKIIASPENSSEELMTAFMHGSASLMNVRVERLIAWRESRPAAVRQYSQWHAVGLALVMAIIMSAALAVTYSHLLAQVHTATEWLVR
jgi:Zn-dependent protease with chaperone function